MPWPIYRLRYLRRLRIFERNPVRQGDVVFLADSITQTGKWEDFFPDSPTRNRGIAGDTTRRVLARVPEVARGHPAKVFVLIGTNDVSTGTGT